MSLFNKLRTGTEAETPRRGPEKGHTHPTAAPVANRPQQAVSGPGSVARGGRLSNALKEFLWHLDGIGHGHLLDVGPAWQSTISFFIERDFKVYTQDLLAAWKDFLDSEQKRARELPPDADRSDLTPAARAERFLETTLRYPDETFDAVLLWDLLDYVDAELVTKLVARLDALVRDGGVVLAIFHARKPESFYRYRVLDAQHLELVPAAPLLAPQRVYQNREISNLFEHFRSSKSFVGRDQLRETLFVR